MKALLLDPTTTKIVSMVYSQTQILEQEVYLVEQLGKYHEPMTHLKATVFIQPTEANIALLIRELKEPKFCEYHLYFSNIVPPQMLTRLGRADEHEVVRQVQEYYADYLVVNEDLFHLGIENSLLLSATGFGSASGSGFSGASASASTNPLLTSNIHARNTAGILSVLLSLKKRPSQIRYTDSSSVAKQLAQDVCSTLEKDDIFDGFRGRGGGSSTGSDTGPLLLILDRMDDPITPLLTQWTYQAMVHELLGIHNNRVILKNTPGAASHKNKDLDEVVLSCTQDEFFHAHRYDNFGDLGEAIKVLLQEYQQKSSSNANISSIEDMQAFIERYPAFRSTAINVSKHVALVSELARLTDVCQLLSISQLEQEIACGNNSDHSTHKRDLFAKIRSPSIVRSDKIRLALLYLLRYESYNELQEIKQLLIGAAKASSNELSLLDAALAYAGDRTRAPGLFGTGGVGGMLASLSKQLVTSIHGIENVYTQHQPLLVKTLESVTRDIQKGRIKESLGFSFSMGAPSAGGGSGSSGSGNGSPNGKGPTEIIVFMVGGTTFEEALKVRDFNLAQAQGGEGSMRVYLGGSCIQNSVSFIREMKDAYKG